MALSNLRKRDGDALNGTKENRTFSTMTSAFEVYRHSMGQGKSVEEDVKADFAGCHVALAGGPTNSAW